MSEPLDDKDLPQPKVTRQARWGLSVIWLVPLIAAIAALVLMMRAWLASGPEITIRFDNAEGLEAGQTEVRYKNVVVGHVRRIRLARDHQQVLVKVELTRDAAKLAVEDTRFWVVRPRVGLGGVSGLNTLISGAYIGIDVGHSEETQDEFVGLDVPPTVTNDQQGRRFILEAADLGYLDIDAPVYFRRRQVGRLVGHALRDDGRGVTMEVFVDAPYDKYVTTNTRFWNASGIDIDLDAGGFKLDTQSLTTVIAGGVAFEAPEGEPQGAVAAENHHYVLFDSRTTALAALDGPAFDVIMRFDQSMRGLNAEAPVDFRGVKLGEVTSTRLDYDERSHRLISVVEARLYPERLGDLYRNHPARKTGAGSVEAFFASLIGDGLRAQLRTGNLLTGQLFVSLDIERRGRKVKLDADARPFEMPTVAGSLSEIQQQIASIVTKLDQMPLAELSQNLNSTIANADRLLEQLDQQLAPEARALLGDARRAVDAANRNLVADDAGLQRDAQATLRSVERMARSMRELSDYLQRHPQALLFGLPDDDQPDEPAEGSP